MEDLLRFFVSPAMFALFLFFLLPFSSSTEPNDQAAALQRNFASKKKRALSVS